MRITFLNSAQYEKEVIYNKKIIKKYTHLGQYSCNKQFWVRLVVLFSPRTLIFFCAFDFNSYLTFSNQNLFLYSLYYAEACKEFAVPISTSLRPSNTAPFEKMSKQWKAVGNTVSDLTGSRFAPQTSCSQDERATLDQLASHLTSYQVKLQLYYK